MSELLLELLSEEIPARMQPKAAGDLASVIESNLKNARLDFSTLKTFVTPRRITINVHGLPYQQPDILVEKKGPRVGAPEEAINGFLKSSGVSINDCEQRETAKGLVWFSTKMDAGRKTSEILENLIPNALSQITWENPCAGGGTR